MASRPFSTIHLYLTQFHVIYLNKKTIHTLSKFTVHHTHTHMYHVPENPKDPKLVTLEGNWESQVIEEKSSRWLCDLLNWRIAAQTVVLRPAALTSSGHLL